MVMGFVVCIIMLLSPLVGMNDLNRSNNCVPEMVKDHARVNCAILQEVLILYGEAVSLGIIVVRRNKRTTSREHKAFPKCIAAKIQLSKQIQMWYLQDPPFAYIIRISPHEGCRN